MELFRKAANVSVVAKHGRTGVLTAMDGLRFLKSLRSRVADVVFLDPPFNLGKDYGLTSLLESSSPEEYESYLEETLIEGARILKPGGALFLYHIPYWASRLSRALQSQLVFRHWIAISMKNGFVRGRRLYPAHYALLYYTKGAPRRFSRPRYPPAQCRHCGGLVKDYGGYLDIVSAQGINLSDFWDDLSPVRHRSTKVRAANQLPVQLTDRVLDMTATKGMLLVDPFAGSGTTLMSAVRHGVRFVANDLSRRNLRISLKRLHAAKS